MSSAPSGSSFVISQALRSALVAVIRKRVPESEVEDIVQATLADAIGSPHAPAEAEAFRRWVFGIAKHKVVDYHRRAGRESFEVPEVAGQGAPHIEADLLRWAEKNLPPGEENQTTLDWMLREGEGEKLESIAETERVPAPRVRQRVSRLRRHLKAHWQKEVALLVAVGIAVGIFLLARRQVTTAPIAKEGIERAFELRKTGLEQCRAADWTACLDKLDQAKQLDPAGDARSDVQQARDAAKKALTPAPVPSDNVTPPPSPTSQILVPDAKTKALPMPTSSALAPMKVAPPKVQAPTKAPAKPMSKAQSSDDPWASSTAVPSPAPTDTSAPTWESGGSGGATGKTNRALAPSKKGDGSGAPASKK